MVKFNHDFDLDLERVATIFKEFVGGALSMTGPRGNSVQRDLDQHREALVTHITHTKEEIDACRDSLSFEQIDERLENIGNAYTKTCGWLFQQQEYKDWIDKALAHVHHGFLWIKGKPGAGKSTIMKYALKSAKKLGNATVASFFFNARGTILERSVLGMYRSVLYQLSKTIQPLQDMLVSTYLRKKKTNDVYDWTIRDSQTLLEHMIEDLPPHHQLVLFIDAIDECKDDEIRDMVEFFESLGDSAVLHRKSLNICLASRHYPHISVRNSLGLVVDDRSGHEEDIGKYVKGRFKAPKNRTTDSIRDEILRKASGVFLWVVLVKILNEECDYGRGTPYQLRKKLDELPPGLDELFARIISRDDKGKPETILTLQWLLFTKRPLEREELYFAVMLQSEPGALEDWAQYNAVSNSVNIDRFILSCSKGLAEISRGRSKKVQFIHESVRDFFLKKNGFAEFDRNLQANVVGLGENELKRCCYECIMACNCDDILEAMLPKAKSKATKDLQERVCRRFSLLRYAVEYLFVHADVAQQLNVSQDKFLAMFKDSLSQPLQRWTKFHNVFEKHSIRRHSPNVNLLYILSKKNLVSLTRALLQDRRYVRINIDARGEHYGSAIQMASVNGYTQIVELLCIAGANVDIHDDKNPSPLTRALLNKHEVLAKLLLDKGADVNVQDASSSAIYVASDHGYEAIVKLLLDKGADVNAQGGHYGSALQAASDRGHEAIVKLLLDKGAKNTLTL